ncbi:hypothetical protein B0H13DRAFT_1877833 [Mycena leptocephala]|nr:hypothetical protein B0H13DRAFT_1877833 [Mycena leptocephala]
MIIMEKGGGMRSRSAQRRRGEGGGKAERKKEGWGNEGMRDCGTEEMTGEGGRRKGECREGRGNGWKPTLGHEMCSAMQARVHEYQAEKDAPRAGIDRAWKYSLVHPPADHDVRGDAAIRRRQFKLRASGRDPGLIQFEPRLSLISTVATILHNMPFKLANWFEL